MTSLTTTPENNRQIVLDRLKHRLSCEILARFSVTQIKTKALENLSRWRVRGTWGAAYEEWEAVLRNPDDQVLITMMIDWSDKANQMRQSAPYVGMLEQAFIKRCREESVNPGFPPDLASRLRQKGVVSADCRLC